MKENTETLGKLHHKLVMLSAKVGGLGSFMSKADFHSVIDDKDVNGLAIFLEDVGSDIQIIANELETLGRKTKV